jgi:hypothetical protein
VYTGCAFPAPTLDGDAVDLQDPRGGTRGESRNIGICTAKLTQRRTRVQERRIRASGIKFAQT